MSDIKRKFTVKNINSLNEWTSDDEAKLNYHMRMASRMRAKKERVRRASSNSTVWLSDGKNSTLVRY